jgi:hypothetical protein
VTTSIERAAIAELTVCGSRPILPVLTVVMLTSSVRRIEARGAPGIELSSGAPCLGSADSVTSAPPSARFSWSRARGPMCSHRRSAHSRAGLAKLAGTGCASRSTKVY